MKSWSEVRYTKYPESFGTTTKNHIKKFQKIWNYIFFQNNLPLLRYNGRHDPQVVSCLRQMQIPEHSLTSVLHLFGFPLSRRYGTLSSPVWVWGTRSIRGDSYPASMVNGRGTATPFSAKNARFLSRYVKEHCRASGKNPDLISRVISTVRSSSLYQFVPKGIDNSNDSLFSMWQLHEQCFHSFALW